MGGAVLMLCLATVVSVNSVAIKGLDTTPYPTYPTTWIPITVTTTKGPTTQPPPTTRQTTERRDTTENVTTKKTTLKTTTKNFETTESWQTTERRDTTPHYTTFIHTDPTATTKNYDTTTNRIATTERPTPEPSPHKPNPDLNCYGHFTYKEGHNIIVDGKNNRHHNPVECEISCYDVTDCRFWKFTGGNGLEKGFCELNSGEPLGHAEVIGQRDVKLIDPGYKAPYCEFPPNHHHHHNVTS